MPRTAAPKPPKRTAIWILDNEITPVLTTLTKGQARLEKQNAELGLNGHTVLLKAFLEDQAARKKSREAWEKVRSDIGRRFGWLQQPRKLGIASIKAVALAAVSAYIYALFYGKITFPFHIH